jgi:hypothetical protein
MPGLISGVKGESVFHEPLLRFFRDNPIPELLSKTANLQDDRLLAVVTMLVVEDRLDKALRSFLPRYDPKSFNFARKIKIMTALALIPNKIIEVASLFGSVRNAFAHNLQIDSFERLETSLIQRVRELGITINPVPTKPPGRTFTEDFKFLSFFCVVGLDSYSANLSYLRTHISTPEFVEALFEKNEAENLERLNAVTAKEPIKVQNLDGHIVKEYEGSVFTIDGTDGAGPLDLGKIWR